MGTVVLLPKNVDCWKYLLQWPNNVNYLTLHACAANSVASWEKTTLVWHMIWTLWRTATCHNLLLGCRLPKILKRHTWLQLPDWTSQLLHKLTSCTSGIQPLGHRWFNWLAPSLIFTFFMFGSIFWVADCFILSWNPCPCTSRFLRYMRAANSPRAIKPFEIIVCMPYLWSTASHNDVRHAGESLIDGETEAVSFLKHSRIFLQKSCLRMASHVAVH